MGDNSDFANIVEITALSGVEIRLFWGNKCGFTRPSRLYPLRNVQFTTKMAPAKIRLGKKGI